jgi:simple sugar transport system permease protein
MSQDVVVSAVATAISGSAAILLAATGELLVEKVGVYNIALEGVMLVGALGGVIADVHTGSWAVGLLAGAGVGALFALIFGLVTVVLRTDMIVVGVALIFVALGFTDVVGAKYVGVPLPATIPKLSIPGLSNLPFLGPAIFQESGITYLAALLPFVVAYLLARTRHGLNIRSIGENPYAADTAGIAVVGWRLFYVGVGGALGGIGGTVLTLGIVNGWVSDVTAGQGWIAFAIVFFAGWRARGVLLGAYFFGGLSVLGTVGQVEGWNVPSQVFTALPYIGTVSVMIARAWLQQRKGQVSWPAALGVPFYRG